MSTTAPFDSNFLSIGDCRIEILQGGDGPPILVLHGAGGAGVWPPALTDLARDHAVLLPSHPGFGGSEWPEWLDGVDDVVLHYIDFIEAIWGDRPGTRPIVMGTSLGGWIAAELAIARPDLIDRLILVDAAGLLLPGVEVPDIFPLTPEQTIRLLFHDPAIADRAVAALAGRSPEQIERANRDRAATARLAWQPYFANPKLERRLPRLRRLPVLIVWGADDRLFPPVFGETYAKAIPGARQVVIPNCGHSPLIERPAELVAAVREFLAATQ